MMKVIFRNSQGAVLEEALEYDEEAARQRAAKMILETPVHDGDKIEFVEE